MAADDTEIEIKLAVDEKTFLNIKDKLKKIAKFEKKSKQKDEYFTPAHRNFVEPAFPFEWLSIRERGNKAILNYKHFYPENVETFTHCDEYETEIQAPEKINKIFCALNLKKLITVKKERETYNYKNEFEIALDKVEELGFFIEIESTENLADVDKTRKKLFKFAESLGLDVSKADKRGYPYLLMEKTGLIK
jgi:adenylate cyclase class 2